MKKAIYPGSFDPFHNGHLMVVKKGLKIFDEIIIIVSRNINKPSQTSYLSRVQIINNFLVKNALTNRVRVLINEDKLTAKLAQELDINFLLRGIRNETDFQYEYELAKANFQLNHQLETIFIFAEEKDQLISSTLLKEIKEYS